MTGPPLRVSVVILNYGAEPSLLREAIDSVLRSETTACEIVEVVVADNASPRFAAGARAVVEALGGASLPARWIAFERNHGFAGGNNRAIAATDATADTIFLLNPDAVVEAGAIDACARRLTGAGPDVVSIAPKILLAAAGDGHDVIDAVGNAVNERGEAFNVGLGQPDLGQYDNAGSCFGPCFAAAMFRRSAFDAAEVGPLDESLFLYYEDVDWNWRAQLLGYGSLTEPSARIRHRMSATSRHLGYGFKFHLTERNLMLCSLKHFERRRAASVIARRAAGLLRGSLRGHYPLDGLRAVAGAALRTPRASVARRRLQRRRARSDDEVLAFGRGEQTFFDAVAYQPIRREEAEAFARARLSQVHG